MPQISVPLTDNMTDSFPENRDTEGYSSRRSKIPRWWHFKRHTGSQISPGSFKSSEWSLKVQQKATFLTFVSFNMHIFSRGDWKRLSQGASHPFKSDQEQKSLKKAFGFSFYIVFISVLVLTLQLNQQVSKQHSNAFFFFFALKFILSLNSFSDCSQ